MISPIYISAFSKSDTGMYDYLVFEIEASKQTTIQDAIASAIADSTNNDWYVQVIHNGTYRNYLAGKQVK